MKRKDELKSDIVSSIDETILERVAKKRMAFMFGGRRRRQKKIVWISSIAAAACFCILVSSLLWQFLPIAPGASGKQVPIYQGMSISSEKQFVKEETADPDAFQYTTLSLDSWYADSNRVELLDGDMTSDTTGNPEKPKKPIEDLAEDSLKVEGAAEKIYYAKPNQDIYITVHVSNPDNFEILSFTLNGKVYSSYMFEDGSDMENLILKYNVGEAEGVVEYTIDAIKYVDGTEIKDVVMEGDKTVQCGVYTENQPTADLSNEVVGINKLTLTVTITDSLNLIGVCGGKAAFVLSDGEQVISIKELVVGEETVITVDTLLTDSDYEYAIVALYDPLDGDGMRPVVLYSKQIRTYAVVAFDSVIVTQSGIQFAYVWNAAFENKVLTSVSLYKGEEKLKDIALDATNVDGLLSNTAYQIIITYENKGKSESVTLDFTTVAKTVPTLTLEYGEVKQEEFAFVLDYTDIDKVGAISKIELLHGEDTPIVAENADVRSFAGLLSDNNYTVCVTVTYDLNDGKGEQSFDTTLTVKTEAKTIPTLTLEKGEVKQEEFTFVLDYTDIDKVGAISKIELLHGEDEAIVAENADVRSFAGLLSDNNYTVRVTVTYNLNDGKGEQSFDTTLTVKTKTKAVPTLSILNQSVTKNSVTAELQMIDTDGVLLTKTITLYENGEKKQEAAWAEKLLFSGLRDYTDHKIVVEYTYDLNNGKGVQTQTAEYAFKTEPHIDVTAASVRNTSALFEGETIFLQAMLDNPHNATITALTVNGKRYAATSLSATALSEITVDASLGSGAVDLTVESVTLTLDGKSYTVACDTLCSADVFINGKFEFIGWDFVNAAHESINVLIPGEETYFRIKLNNPTDYTLDSVTIYGERVLKGEDLIKLDQNTYLHPVTFVSNEEPDGAENAGLIVMMYGYGSENNAMQVHSLSYSNEYVNSTLDQVEGRYRSVYVLRSNEIRKISSVEDLYNLNEHIRYELTCDLDLAGVEWKAVPFSGMLNGNGYAIKNMSFVGTVNDVNGGVSLGLFSSAIGLIENLHMKNAFTFVTTSTKEVIYGAIAARADHLVLKNCSVDAASSVLITTSGYGYIGGLVGEGSEDTVIENCVNHSALSVNVDSVDSHTYIGGIVGYVWDNCSVVSCVNYGTIEGEGVYGVVGGIVGINNGGTVSKCTNSGDVAFVNVSTSYNDSYVGGIAGNNTGTVMSCTNAGIVTGDCYIGGMAGYNTGTVSNCTNAGIVTGDIYVGGMVGYNVGKVSNCINIGNVSSDVNCGAIVGQNLVGGIVGDNAGGTVMSCTNAGIITGDIYVGGIAGGVRDLLTNLNCYTTNQYKTTVGNLVTLQTLAKKSFWTDTLGWDEAIWNFDDLDPENGKYPTLR